MVRASSSRLGFLGALLLAHCGDDGHADSPSSDATDTGDTQNSRDASGAKGGSGLDATTGSTQDGGHTGGSGSDGGATNADAQAPDGANDAATTNDRSDAGNVSASGGASQKIANPPTYLAATSAGNACTAALHTVGYEPADSDKHPLFLYFVGTKIVAADASSDYDCKAAAAVTEAMARRGFVAASVEYQNMLSDVLIDKFSCLFDESRTGGLLATLCARPNVDCDKGIATWGHSQGAMLAHIASNYDTRVRAVWTTGYSGNSGVKLSYDRLRVVNGEADTMNSDNATINKAANFTGSAVCASGDQCLRTDGSGWIIVRKSQCQVTAADHCWFDKKSCVDNDETLEPNWVDADSKAAFGLETNADWVATTLARP